MKSVLVTWKWMVVALAAAGLQTVLGAAFEKNAKVVFLGDSITHQARWTSFVTRYYLEWLPEQNVTFYNAGVGGDTMSPIGSVMGSEEVPPKPARLRVLGSSSTLMTEGWMCISTWPFASI